MFLKFDALYRALPRWWKSAATWAVRFACYGPEWIPCRVRKIPVQLLRLVVTFYIWRLS